MTVSVMASGQIGSDGTGNISGTHSPGGQPHAVVVFVVQNGSSTDEVSGVTYGGVAMSSGGRSSDTAGEPGSVEAFYLYTRNSIPSGDQTVAMTASGSGATKRVYCVSFSTDAAGLSSYSTAGDSADQANPSDVQAINANYFVSGVACLFSGNTAANISVANGAELAEADFSGNAQAASLIWANTTVNNANITMGWTVASDDVAARYIYFYELVAISGNVTLSGSPQSGAEINIIYDNGFGYNLPGSASFATTDGSGNWSEYVGKGWNIIGVLCTYDNGAGSIYTSKIHWNMDTTP